MNKNDQKKGAATVPPQQKSCAFSYMISPFWQLGLLLLFYLGKIKKKKKKTDKGENGALFPITAQGV